MAQANPTAATETEPPARDDYPTHAQKRALVACAIEHLRDVVSDDRQLDVDPGEIEWTVSTNTQRTSSAGTCRYNKTTGELTITLAWAAYAEWGWEQFAETVRHEYVHAWLFVTIGSHGHGWQFKRVARDLDTHVHCQKFAEKRLVVTCPEGCEFGRDRASSFVQDPEGRVCKPHGAPLTVTHRSTRRSWTTATGYKRVRNKIERSPNESW